MIDKKICIKCGKEFIPKQHWMKICPECYKDVRKDEYHKKIERNKETMELMPLDPLNTTTLDFGVYKGYNLFQIYYTDKDYFKYLQDSVSNSKFNDKDKELREELSNLEKRLYKYIIRECFKRLRKSLSNNETVYSKGIHAVGIEYGIDEQFYIQQILSNKPVVYLWYEGCYSIGMKLQSESFLNLLEKLHDITNGDRRKYSCYTLF